MSDEREEHMSAYNLGQLFGVALLVAIVVGVARDVMKKRRRGDDDRDGR